MSKEKHASSNSVVLTQEEKDVLDFILPLSQNYPDIETWFKEKVVPGARDGSRKIITFKNSEKIIAIGIGKKGEENKICTVRVAPDYRGQGLGTHLFSELMSWMGENKPLVTVSEDKLKEFEKLFKKFGYDLTSVKKDLYKDDKDEILFNEDVKRKRPNKP